ITKPLLVKVGALCIKKEGAHFDTPSLFFFREHSLYMYLLRLGRRACESSSTFFPQRKERLPFL
ncbi:hypothetical protein, partial [Phocaeicola vulgatus]